MSVQYEKKNLNLSNIEQITTTVSPEYRLRGNTLDKGYREEEFFQHRTVESSLQTQSEKNK